MLTLSDAIVVLIENGYDVTFTQMLAKVKYKSNYSDQPDKIIEENVYEVRARHRAGGPWFCSKGLQTIELRQTVLKLVDYVKVDRPLDMSFVTE